MKSTRNDIINKNIESELSDLSDKEMLEDIYDSTLEEIISTFNTPRTRFHACERYLFYKEDVENVMKRIKRPETVKCETDLNPDGTVFCYILSLVNPNRKY